MNLARKFNSLAELLKKPIYMKTTGGYFSISHANEQLCACFKTSQESRIRNAIDSVV